MQKLNDTNCLYLGAEGRESLYDLILPENWNGTVVLFVHGYMGFKDWGCWNLVADFFSEHGYGFAKYNVSHNGGTTKEPIDFPDTEAFSQNTYSKELLDFEVLVDTLQKRLTDFQLFVIGHSRGGGIAALQSGHPAVKKWVSWAGISNIGQRFPKGEALEAWRENTHRYVKNGRTQQDLPHHFQQYLDYEQHRDRLDIEQYCRRNTKPCLIVHGEKDSSVLPEEGERLAEWTQTPLVLIENTQHTFDAAHPWELDKMPEALLQACKKTMHFFEVSPSPDR